MSANMLSCLFVMFYQIQGAVEILYHGKVSYLVFACDMHRYILVPLTFCFRTRLLWTAGHWRAHCRIYITFCQSFGCRPTWFRRRCHWSTGHSKIHLQRSEGVANKEDARYPKETLQHSIIDMKIRHSKCHFRRKGCATRNHLHDIAWYIIQCLQLVINTIATTINAIFSSRLWLWIVVVSCWIDSEQRLYHNDHGPLARKWL